jgi:hypothetical protein
VQCAYIRIEKTEALTGARVWTNYDDEEENVERTSNILPGEVHVPAEDAPGDAEDADEEADDDADDEDEGDEEDEPVQAPEPVKPVKKERKKALAKK